MSNRRPIALIILDGFGKAPDAYPREFDATRLAHTPTIARIRAEYPTVLIRTSGNDVGLPDGVMGNSEVGHMNLGAGRVVWQELVRIDKAAEKDNFASVPALRAPMERVKANGKRLHLFGCTSDGSVHSVDRHYFALLRLAKQVGLRGDQVAFHVFTDGRDCPPKSGAGHVTALRDWMRENGTGVIATVTGRYYGMDRDKRWERTQLAYDAMCLGQGRTFQDAVEAVAANYADGVNDEFVKPSIIVGGDGNPLALISDGDDVISFNYRADRVRQISRALTQVNFAEFQPKEMTINLTTFTPYYVGLHAVVAFPPQELTNTLGEVVAKAGRTQVRMAETEKYPHVSFFFSGGREEPFSGENRIMTPSPREVATYDLKPEMSEPEVAAKAAAAVRSTDYDLIVLNFANPDMVGHTGIVEAATKACEATDAGLAEVLQAILELGGAAIVTADHGNCEEMWNFEANAPHTQHTTNPVPLTLVDDQNKNMRLREGGRLADVAPTLLQLLGIPQPAEMDGKSLLQL